MTNYKAEKAILLQKMRNAKTEEEYNTLRAQLQQVNDNIMREQGIDPISHNYIR